MSSGGLNTNRLILVEDMVRENGCPCLFQTAFSSHGEEDTVHQQVTTGAIGKIEKITSLQTAKMRILHDDSVRDRRYSRNPVERSSFERCEINIPVVCPVRVIRADNRKRYNSISQIMEDMPPYIRVEEDIMGISTADDEVKMFRVPKNTVLKLHTNQTENKYLLCLMNETKEVMFYSSCTGEFTGLDDKVEYALADLLEKVQLPVQVDLHTVNKDDISNEDETLTDNLRTMLSGPVEIVSVARTQVYVGCIWICEGTYQPFVLPIKSGMYCYPLARIQSKEALVSRNFSSKIDFESLERKIYNINVDPPSILFLKKIVVARRNVPTTGSLDEKDQTPSRKEETNNDYQDVSPVLPYKRALRRSLSGDINVNYADSMSNAAPQLPPGRNRSRHCRPLTSYTPSRDYFRNEVQTNCGKGMGEQPTKALVQHDSMVKNMSSKLSNRLEMFQRKAQNGTKNEHDELKKPVTNKTEKQWKKLEKDASVTVEKIQDGQSINADAFDIGDIMPVTKTKTPNGDCYDPVVVQSDINSENKTNFQVGLNPSPVGKVTDHKTVCNTNVPNISLGLNTCSVDHQATDVPISNKHPIEDEDYMEPIPPVYMLTKQARKSFYSFSVMQIVHCFRSCRLDTLANICEKEKLDGSFFQNETEENMSQLLLKEPFCLNAFQILKVNKIIDGWRPKMDKFGGVSRFT